MQFFSLFICFLFPSLSDILSWTIWISPWHRLNVFGKYVVRWARDLIGSFSTWRKEPGYEVSIYIYHQFYIYQVSFVVMKDGVVVPGHFAERQFAEGHFAERHFAEGHFAERIFCRKAFCRNTFCGTDILPKDNLPNGLFAERTICGHLYQD